jgi:hypothetical protein
MAVHSSPPPLAPIALPSAPPLNVLHSPEFWIAAGTSVLAAATVVLIIIGVAQIYTIKREARRSQTLATCDRYTFDPILDSCLRALRDAKKAGNFDTKEKDFRLEITTILNYLEGLSLGIFQGLYIEDLARDNLQSVVIDHVNEYLKDGMPKKIEFDARDFPFTVALATRWAEISTPRFREKDWRLSWRRFR